MTSWSRLGALRICFSRDALLIHSSDVVGDVVDLMLGRQMQVEVANALSVRLEQLALAWQSLLGLDQVEHGHRRAVASEEVVEVQRCS